ncbi:MAG: extradiol dioxygenase family protein [Pseudohongiellaceae bacterium]
MELTLQVFHLALPVTDIAASITFYTAYFNCQLGRQAARWVDLNFFGHQLSLHLSEDHKSADQCSNRVDGDQIHVPHFGVVLEKGPWQALHQKLKEGGVEFRLEPKIRFAGEAGEQGTFFIKDPSGNTLEFKYFDSADDIFATD